jgi:hypothetical protein
MPSIAHPAINCRALAPWLVRTRIIASTKLPVAHLAGLFRRFRRVATLNILKARTTGNAVSESRRRMRLVSREIPQGYSAKNPRHFSASAGGIAKPFDPGPFCHCGDRCASNKRQAPPPSRGGGSILRVTASQFHSGRVGRNSPIVNSQ